MIKMSQLIEQDMLPPLKEAAISSLHAFDREACFEVRFTTSPTKTVGSVIYLTEPQPGMALKQWRAEIDRAILKIIYYDAVIAHQFMPSQQKTADFYKRLLQYYCDLKGAHLYPGVAINLKYFYEYDSEEDVYLYHIDSLLWDCPPEKALSLELQSQINLLKASFDHFQEYAYNAQQLALLLYPLIDTQGYASGGSLPASGDSDIFGDHDAQQHDTNEDIETHTDDTPQDLPEDEESLSQTVLSLPEDTDQPLKDASQLEIVSFDKNEFAETSLIDFYHHKRDYHIFTKECDSVDMARDLVKDEEKLLLQEQFYRALEQYRPSMKAIAARLKMKLRTHQQHLSRFASPQGNINPKKLPQFILNPLETDIFKKENPFITQDIIVSLLIDCSGSMRGQPIMTAALSAYLIADILEKCSVKTEILGFTTKQWKGGESKKIWEEKGGYPLPGRLNDLQHIIYKNAHDSWKKSKENIPVLLKESILKENIDGEALLWAFNRLKRYDAQRRILMVLSDGAPVDDQTSSANDPNFLERHLCNVIQMIEKKSNIELLAVGIGHDVTRYYEKSVTIKNSDQLTKMMIEQLITLFSMR